MPPELPRRPRTSSECHREAPADTTKVLIVPTGTGKGAENVESNNPSRFICCRDVDVLDLAVTRSDVSTLASVVYCETLDMSSYKNRFEIICAVKATRGQRSLIGCLCGPAWHLSSLPLFSGSLFLNTLKRLLIALEFI